MSRLTHLKHKTKKELIDDSKSRRYYNQLNRLQFILSDLYAKKD